MSADTDRSILSSNDWKRPGVAVPTAAVQIVLLLLLIGVGLLPLLWLAKSAITPTQDTLQTPMALFPHGFAWANLAHAWNDVHIGSYFVNTIWVTVGEWAMQLLVATTGGYALAILKPAYAKVVTGLVLATLLPTASVDLVDSVAKKTAFIARAAETAGIPNARAVTARAEDMARQVPPEGGRESYDVVTARAVGRLSTLAELASPLLREGGVLVAWKGKRDEEEEQQTLRASSALAMTPESNSRIADTTLGAATPAARLWNATTRRGRFAAR